LLPLIATRPNSRHGFLPLVCFFAEKSFHCQI
jgi:hypothetical protein